MGESDIAGSEDFGEVSKKFSSGRASPWRTFSAVRSLFLFLSRFAGDFPALSATAPLQNYD